MFNKNKKICITIVIIMIMGVILGNGTVLSMAAEPVDKEQTQIVNINEDSNGKQIDLKVGQILLVELDGKELIEEKEFSWQLSEEPKYTLNLHNSFKNKDENKECWVFSTKGEGGLNLSFKSDNKDFKVSVTVKKEKGVVYAGASKSQINIIKGQKLKIMLDSNATTGYSWNLTGAPDSTILYESSNYYVSYPTPPGWAGGGGVSHFVFDSLSVGSTKIELKYARSWEITNTTEDTYTINVNVVENKMDSPEIIKINEEDNGKEITAKQGKIIKVELNNKETDKKWELLSTLDKNVINKILSCTDTDLAKDCFVLMTKGEGTQDLKFNLGDKSFVVKVIVKQPQGVVFIDEDYNGKEVLIKKGDTLELALAGNASTGYDWVTAKSASSSYGVLSGESGYTIQYPVPMGWVGAGCMRYWNFAGYSVGTTTIYLKYTRVFQSSEPDLKTFSVKVKVVDGQPSPTPHADYFLEGYVKTDGVAEGEVVNKGYKVEIVESSWSAYTDDNGKFTIPVIVLSEDQVYKLKITKANCLERVVDVTCGKTITMWLGDLAVGGAQDKCINLMDVMAIAKAFNTQPSEERYNADCDLNCDGSINMADVIIIAKHFNAVSSDYSALK